MLEKDKAVFVLVDVQGKLAQIMHEKAALFDNLQRLVKGMQVLGVPIVWMEQNPDGLGPTIPELADLLPDQEPIAKLSFSCCGEENFVKALEAAGRKQVIIAGIEAHICVYQTSMDLLSRGYEVHAVADGMSSRKLANKQIGLDKIKAGGGHITSVEIALSELLKVAEGDQFKAMLKIVK